MMGMNQMQYGMQPGYGYGPYDGNMAANMGYAPYGMMPGMQQPGMQQPANGAAAPADAAAAAQPKLSAPPGMPAAQAWACMASYSVG